MNRPPSGAADYHSSPLLFATAITGAKDAGELPAELDADDLADAILAHVEGLFVIAKARNDPAVFEPLPRDVERLLGRGQS